MVLPLSVRVWKLKFFWMLAPNWNRWLPLTQVTSSRSILSWPSHTRCRVLWLFTLYGISADVLSAPPEFALLLGAISNAPPSPPSCGGSFCVDHCHQFHK